MKVNKLVGERERIAKDFLKILKEKPHMTYTAYENYHGYKRGTVHHYVDELNEGKFDNLTDEEKSKYLLPRKKVNKTVELPETSNTLIQDKIEEGVKIVDTFHISIQLDRIERILIKLYDHLT